MNLNKPQPFTPNKNHTARDWQIWKEEFLVYLKLSNGYSQFSEEQRALLLINFMGTEAIRAMEEIPFEKPIDKKDMDILLLKFDEFFNPSLNEVEERYKFFSRRKNPNEDLDKYISDLKERATKCNFGNQSEKFIIDMLVLSMDIHLRELIWASKLETLTDIIYNYKQYNINEDQMVNLFENPKQNLTSRNSENVQSYNDRQPRKNPPAKRICSKCGTNHPYKQCPAYDNVCQMCFCRGHYTTNCKLLESFSRADSSTGNKTEENKPSTSKAKQSQERVSQAHTLQQCLWCDSHHLPGKCPHDATCTTCNNFPHKICFQCKRNPHDYNCYYRNIITLPDIQNIGYIKPNQSSRTTNQTNTRAQSTVNDLLDGFVEIEHAFRTQTQPQRQTPNQGPRQANQTQHRQNPRNTNNNKNKNEKSEPCSIS